MFIEECKTEHRRLKSEADRIPARMEELERQQSQAPTETMAELSAQIELDGAKRRQSELERQKEYLARQIGGKEKQRLAMLAKYRELKSTTAGKCPTCGQAIPADLFEAKRDEKLLEQLAELEGKQLRAEKYQHERLVLFEGQINGCFEHMRFKLFERLANGTLKETCEAMMDGVPYSSLSKGEKLKAALDLLRALQKVYGVEMPLILDDAESYTSNSFVELPNQKFYFRVSENDLAIEIMEASAAA